MRALLAEGDARPRPGLRAGTLVGIVRERAKRRVLCVRERANDLAVVGVRFRRA